ncbi:UNKNOWN [Stylonychia lemnae]|uniref:YHYH domain-containing protein n=1 Tax=Stylonychia lemnae TaxID=5949 RepID=A0A078A4L2_STYLE|nr:UNKNOWN [Stylonychia lemnae]|eukprot:CDW77193.1 UNKNOWN [Stylonychia lemnae]
MIPSRKLKFFFALFFVCSFLAQCQGQTKKNNSVLTNDTIASNSTDSSNSTNSSNSTDSSNSTAITNNTNNTNITNTGNGTGINNTANNNSAINATNSTVAQIGLLGTSYNECVAFMSLVQCTECLTLNNVTFTAKYPYGQNQDYEEISCPEYTQITCPDGIMRSTCSWRRYLSFKCIREFNTTGTKASFEIRTNSLPNYCYQPSQKQPLGSQDAVNYYGFSGKFNPPLTYYNPSLEIEIRDAGNKLSKVNYFNQQITKQVDYDNNLCNTQWARDSILRENKYKSINYNSFVGRSFKNSSGVLVRVENSTWGPSLNFAQYQNLNYLELKSSNQVVGVALNGVFIFSGNSIYGYDAFFPKQYGTNSFPKKIETDQCLGTTSESNTYRYHMFSPCIFEIALRDTPSLCVNSSSCSADVRNHSVSHVPSQKRTQTPIGIAKDGRLIYGPYRKDGKLWQPCDVDICNGVIFQDLNYGYVATMFHPYTVGCYGPGNAPQNFLASCSSNARKCLGKNSIYLSITYSLIALLTFASAIFI